MQRLENSTVIGSLLSLLALMLRRSIQDSRPAGAASSITGQWRQVMTDWPAMLRLMGTVGVATAVFYSAGVYYVDEASRFDPTNASLYNGEYDVQIVGLGMRSSQGAAPIAFSPSTVRRSRDQQVSCSWPVDPRQRRTDWLCDRAGHGAASDLFLFRSPLLHPFFPGWIAMRQFLLLLQHGRGRGGGTAPLLSTWLKD